MAAGDIRVADLLNAVRHEMDRVARDRHVLEIWGMLAT